MAGEEERGVVRVKVKKCDGLLPVEFRSFAVDPQITSLEVLQHILIRAFDLNGRRSFGVSYLSRERGGAPLYTSLLSDWDLDAAFVSAAKPFLQLKMEIKPSEDSPVMEEWDIISPKDVIGSEQLLADRTRSLASAALPFTQSLLSQVGRTLSRVQQALSWSYGEELKPFKPPLTDAEFHSYLNGQGQLSRPEDLRLRIYHGGVEPSLRKVVWRYLLNVYPDGLSGQERMDYMKRKTREYDQLKREWTGRVSGEELDFIRGNVLKDVLRTDRAHAYYAGSEDSPHLSALTDLLTTFAITHPQISYCQGMSDIASPILAVMDNEAHAFICFCGIMKRLEGNFRPDGQLMSVKFQHLKLLLQYSDPEFYSYLVSRGADDLFFCYRWLLLELKREFVFDDALRMLEVTWSSLPPDPPETEVELLGPPLEAEDTPSSREAEDTPSSREAGDTASSREAGETASSREAGETGETASSREAGETGETASSRETGETASRRKLVNGREGGAEQKEQQRRRHMLRPTREPPDSRRNTPGEQCRQQAGSGGGRGGACQLTLEKAEQQPSFQRQASFGEFNYYSAGGEDSFELEGGAVVLPRQSTVDSEEDPGERAPLINPSHSCSPPPFPTALPIWKTASSVSHTPSASPSSWPSPDSAPQSPSPPSGGRAFRPIPAAQKLSSPMAVPASPPQSRSLLSSPILSFGRGPSPNAPPSPGATGSSPSSVKPCSLPPPQEFGRGNPFMLFLCLSILLEHRDHIIRNSLDYNELAMHFDRLVRRHNLSRVLQRAKALFADYLQSELWDSEEGDEVSSDSPTAASAPPSSSPPSIPPQALYSPLASPQSSSPNSTYDLTSTIPSPVNTS